MKGYGVNDSTVKRTRPQWQLPFSVTEVMKEIRSEDIIQSHSDIHMLFS